MHLPPGDSVLFRFGPFELDYATGELRKSGLKIRVPDQSLQVLAALLQRAGEIVTREDLASILWPDGTNVDVDDGLNAAVKKLRAALGDSGDVPRFVETVPRRGYRLLVPAIPISRAVPDVSYRR